MFTGLVEVLGSVEEAASQPPGMRLVIRAGEVTDGVEVGDSVAVNGCCLTVVGGRGERLVFEAGSETLGRTNLGRLRPGCDVNLERSIVLGDRLGGHLVTGHIDVVATLDRRKDDGDWSTCWFRVPPPWTRQLAAKGSVAVDGVSLTIVDVDSERFSVALIPHTLNVTTLGQRKLGDAVNLETDILAKYVQRQLQVEGIHPASRES